MHPQAFDAHREATAEGSVFLKLVHHVRLRGGWAGSGTCFSTAGVGGATSVTARTRCWGGGSGQQLEARGLVGSGTALAVV
jgi:hypothetical protein